jgi:hypothetical protein
MQWGFTSFLAATSQHILQYAMYGTFALQAVARTDEPYVPDYLQRHFDNHASSKLNSVLLQCTVSIQKNGQSKNRQIGHTSSS